MVPGVKGSSPFLVDEAIHRPGTDGTVCGTWNKGLQPVPRMQITGDGLEPLTPGERSLSYSTITQSLAPRPKTSGEYISSALVGGAMKRPGVVARAT